MSHYAGKHFIVDLYSLKLARRSGDQQIDLTISSDSKNEIQEIWFETEVERDVEYALLQQAVEKEQVQEYDLPYRQHDRNLGQVLGGIVEYMLGSKVTSKPSEKK